MSEAREEIAEWVRCYEDDEWFGELSPDMFAIEFFNADDAIANRDGTLHLNHAGHSHWATEDEVIRFLEWLAGIGAL